MGQTTLRVYVIDPRIRPAWEAMEPYLEMALEYGGSKDWGVEDIRTMALTGEVLLFALSDSSSNKLLGSGVLAKAVYPRRVVAEVLLFASEPHAGFEEAVPQLKSLAKGLGANALCGTGRAGWARKLRAKERRVWELEL